MLTTPRARLIFSIVVVVVVAVAAFIVVQLTLRANDASAPAPTSSAAAPLVPTTFSSDELGFTAVYPAEPTQSSNTQSVGGVDVILNTVQWTDGVAAASVSITDLSQFIEGQDIDSVLQGSLTGMATSTSSTISSQEFTTLDGQRAISGTIDTNGADDIHAIISVRNGVQYIVISTSLTAAQSDAFLTSFAFLG